LARIAMATRRQAAGPVKAEVTIAPEICAARDEEQEHGRNAGSLPLSREAVGQTRRLARSCTKSTTARFWRGSNQSSKAVDCREAALHDLGLETAGARLWLFYKAIPLSDSHPESKRPDLSGPHSLLAFAFAQEHAPAGDDPGARNATHPSVSMSVPVGPWRLSRSPNSERYANRPT